MNEIEALRARIAVLEWRMDLALVVGCVIAVALGVAVTVLFQRQARADRRLDAREGKGVAGAIVAAVGARRVPKVARKR